MQLMLLMMMMTSKGCCPHVPIQERKLKVKRNTFMDGDLRRATYKNRMLFNIYPNCKTTLNWDNY